MSQTIIITDERPELMRVKHVATHKNVPDNWSSEKIVKQFGIDKHLTVYRRVPSGIVKGLHEIIQRGRRGDPFVTALPGTGVIVSHGKGEQYGQVVARERGSKGVRIWRKNSGRWTQVRKLHPAEVLRRASDADEKNFAPEFGCEREDEL